MGRSLSLADTRILSSFASYPVARASFSNLSLSGDVLCGTKRLVNARHLHLNAFYIWDAHKMRNQQGLNPPSPTKSAKTTVITAARATKHRSDCKQAVAPDFHPDPATTLATSDAISDGDESVAVVVASTAPSAPFETNDDAGTAVRLHMFSVNYLQLQTPTSGLIKYGRLSNPYDK